MSIRSSIACSERKSNAIAPKAMMMCGSESRADPDESVHHSAALDDDDRPHDPEHRVSAKRPRHQEVHSDDDEQVQDDARADQAHVGRFRRRCSRGSSGRPNW
jgi:hypothetical protein